jgi:hypothetical protein
MTMLELTSDLVFAQSDKGAREISRRQHGLSPRQRAMLILVDGNVSVGELLQRTAGFSGALESLHVLIHEGFVNLVRGRVDASAPRAAHLVAIRLNQPRCDGVLDLSRHAAQLWTSLQARPFQAP